MILAAIILALPALIAFIYYSKRHGVGRAVWRFCSGQHMDGVARTDAGMMRPGIRPLTRTGHASRWAHFTHMRRSQVRHAALLTNAGLCAGLVMAPWLTVALSIALTAVTLVSVTLARVFHVPIWRQIRLVAKPGTVPFRVGFWLAARVTPEPVKVRAQLAILGPAARAAEPMGAVLRPAGERVTHRARVVKPMSKALAPLLGVSPPVVMAALTVTPGYAKAKGGETVSTISPLPAHFRADPDQQRMIGQLFESRLGVEIDPRFRMNRSPMALEVIRTPQPPRVVPLAQLLDRWCNAAEGVVVLGLDAAEELATGSFAGEPHWIMNARTRRGKSTWLGLIVAKVVREGGSAVVIDPKSTLGEHLGGVPRVTLCLDPVNVQEMWDAIDGFLEELMKRREKRQQDPTAAFPRMLLILDEANVFAVLSLDHWRKRPVKEKGEPTQPPVWSVILQIAAMGAMFNANIVLVGQRLDKDAFGGAMLIRDSAGLVGMAGFTPAQWQFLIGTRPVPRSSPIKGRCVIAEGESWKWVQFVYATPQETNDLARGYDLEALEEYARYPERYDPRKAERSTRVRQAERTAVPATVPGEVLAREDSPEVPFNSVLQPVPQPRADSGAGAMQVLVQTADVSVLPARRTLRDAAQDTGAGVVPVTLARLESARKRDPSFPQGHPAPAPRGGRPPLIYADTELCDWHENRKCKETTA